MYAAFYRNVDDTISLQPGEPHGGLGALDQVVVPAVEAGCGKVRDAGVEQLTIDLVALKVHRRG